LLQLFLQNNITLRPFLFLVLFFYAGWQNRNAVFFLLLFTLPFSFEYNFSSTLGTDVPDEFLMLFVSGLFFTYWLYSPKAVIKNAWQHPLLLLLFLCLGWTLVTVLFSAQPVISLKFLLAKSWYTGAFVLAPLIIFRQKKNHHYSCSYTGSLYAVCYDDCINTP